VLDACGHHAPAYKMPRGRKGAHIRPELLDDGAGQLFLADAAQAADKFFAVIPATVATPTGGRHPRLADVDPRTGM
jgi:hypothetical protein